MAKSDSRKESASLSKKKKDIEINKPPILFRETQKIIKKIQENLDGDFLTYWISENGDLVQDDVIAFFNILSKLTKIFI